MIDTDKDAKAWKQPHRYGDRPEIEAFIKDIREVCERHGISIGHEDVGGAFILTRWDGDSGLQYAHLDDDLEKH